MITPGAVQIWQGQLCDDDASYQTYWSVLDAIEQAHANKMMSVVRRKEYVQIHALLRYQLARILQTPPEAIVINKTQSGKPYLVDYPELVFNISHTKELFLIAISTHCQMGVDIEYCKQRHNIEGLVHKCFSSIEREYWFQLSEPERLTAFYKFWTRKEAFVKATGRGIVLGLDECVINPNNINQFLSIPANCGEVSDWFVSDLYISDKHVATLVTDQEILEVHMLTINNE